ncbi:MAG: hypothetical protein RIR39_1908 [Pseudomonadota bacterium]
MSKTHKNTLSLISGLTLLVIFTAPVVAGVVAPNTIQFAGGETINVASGDSLTVDLIGANFSGAGPDGAALSLTWDPLVLGYVSTAIANPPWDASFVSETSVANGALDYVFLGHSAIGGVGADFALASFTFNVLGNLGAATTLALSNDSFNVGFVSPGAVPINVNYVNSQVQVVPVPAAVWLFGTGLTGLLGFARNRRTL